MINPIIIYKKKGLIIKGDFPLLREILRLQKLMEPYWDLVRRDAEKEMKARQDSLWGEK